MPWFVVRVVAIWIGILGLAFSNAALRELVLIPRLGKVQGLTLSGVLLSLLILLVAYACLPWLGAARALELIGTGIIWAVLTMAFDLVIGLVQGKPMEQLLGAYFFKDGNLWPIVLLVTVSAPYLVARLRGWT